MTAEWHVPVAGGGSRLNTYFVQMADGVTVERVEAGSMGTTHDQKLVFYGAAGDLLRSFRWDEVSTARMEGSLVDVRFTDAELLN